MYAEEQLLPLSAVGQYVHCPRRFALLHVEQQWEDNRFTAEGTLLHEKADSGLRESRGSVRIIRSLRLCSYELGVTGIADVVEFHRVDRRWWCFPAQCNRKMEAVPRRIQARGSDRA